MEVKSTVHLEDGAVEMVARLDEEESAFLIEWAINHLLANGIQPFLDNDTSEDVTIN